MKCPKCGYVIKVTCKRCGRSWENRKSEPKLCRYCKSPYWNKKRVRKK